MKQPVLIFAWHGVKATKKLEKLLLTQDIPSQSNNAYVVYLVCTWINIKLFIGNMVIVLVTLLLCTLAIAEEEKYTTKYDNVNYEEIIHSERLLQNYVNCLLDKGKCTPDANELKSKFVN